MKLNSAMLALSLGLCAFAAGAQTIDMGPDTSGYRRFLLYPHLERGLAAMARGERRRALVEFEQARLLAPDNPAVTLHLAGAYRHFGNAGYAETVLREQLARHPGHAALTKALEELRARAPAPQEGAGSPSSSAVIASAAARVRSPAGLVPVAQQSLGAGAAPASRHRPGKAASAYALAEQAYKASARGHHGAAVLAARQAVRLAPPTNRD